MESDFFGRIRSCFERHDGSLPGVEIAGIHGDDLARIYTWIRQRSRLADPDVEFWHRAEERSVKLDAYPNPAALVAAGTAEAFNFTFEGFKVDGVELPAFGMFVFSDTIEFYYRMGPHWTEEQMWAFFRMLKAVHELSTTACLQLPVEGPPEPEAFLAEWRSFSGPAAE